MSTGLKMSKKSKSNIKDDKINIIPSFRILLIGHTFLIFVFICLFSVFFDKQTQSISNKLNRIYRGDYKKGSTSNIKNTILNYLIRYSNYYNDTTSLDQNFISFAFLAIDNNTTFIEYIKHLQYNDNIFNITYISPLDETLSQTSFINFSISNPLYAKYVRGGRVRSVKETAVLQVNITLDDQQLVLPGDSVMSFDLSDEEPRVSDDND